MYFSFSHEENQSKLFWYYLGNLIVFKNYGEPKECKKFLEDNFYECLSLNNLLLNLETHNDFEMREKLKILMKQKTIATNDISDFSFSNPLNVLNDREENYSIEEFVKIILSERIAIVYRKTENIFK